MRVTRRRGRVRIHLESVESGLLATLFDDLASALRTLPGDDPVHERLFPSAYPGDDDAAEEFRSLTEDGLRDTRRPGSSCAGPTCPSPRANWTWTRRAASGG